MSTLTDLITILAIGLAAAAIDKARAQPAPVPPATAGEQHRSVIGSGALTGASGRVATNQAAGTGNMQSNQAVMAVGPGAAAHSSASAEMYGPVAIDPHASYSARIESKAMSNMSGLVSVNQASGAGNAQMNLITVVVGDPIGTADDSALSHAAPTARTGGAGATARVAPVVGLAPDALAGSRGVLQLNQVAGGGNASSTELTVRVAPSFR
jgi:hypothetical protein